MWVGARRHRGRLPPRRGRRTPDARRRPLRSYQRAAEDDAVTRRSHAPTRDTGVPTKQYRRGTIAPRPRTNVSAAGRCLRPGEPNLQPWDGHRPAMAVADPLDPGVREALRC